MSDLANLSTMNASEDLSGFPIETESGQRSVGKLANKSKTQRRHQSSRLAAKKPYELDKALCFDKLSFDSETCTNRSCKCCHPKKRRRFVFSVEGNDGQQVILQPPRLVTTTSTRQPLLRQPRLLLRQTTLSADAHALPSTAARSSFSSSSIPVLSNHLVASPTLASSSSAIGGLNRNPVPNCVHQNSSGLARFMAVSSSTGAGQQSLARAVVSDSSITSHATGSTVLRLTSNQAQSRQCQFVRSLSDCSTSSSESGKEAHTPAVSDTTPCSQQARQAEQEGYSDYSMDELACYFDEYVHIPKKMSAMAEMMYG